MSLVHEALQKAEREKQRKLGAAPSPPIPHTAPHPAPAPVFHEPVAIAPVAHAVSHKPAAAVEELPKTNNFLLPALISCVAIVAMVSVIFLVMNATSLLRQSRENPPVAASATPTPGAKTASPAVTPTPDSAAPASVPVQSSTAPATDESKYKLSGIMKDPDGKPVAVLNGRVAYEGYFIDGATVKKIETDRAILDVKGQEVVLRLF
jgi:hypothetical protein